jgi:hypothetical protein
MSVLDVTFHSLAGATLPTFRKGAFEPLGLLPPQTGDSQQIDFSGGPANTAAATEDVIAAVVPDADCRIAVGDAVTATVANSRKLVSGVPEYVHVPAGARIGVRAA